MTTPVAAPPQRTGRRWLPDTGAQRALAFASLVNMTGSGLYLAGGVLYFTRSVGLPVNQVGLGLTAGALAGQLAGIPAGRFADRRGARETYALAKLLGAVVAASFVLVHSFPAFVLVCCLNSFFSAASGASRAPLIRRLGGDDPVWYRAYLRTVSNLGITLGALGAALAVQVDTRAAYLTLIVANAVSSLLCTLAVHLFIPHVPVLARAADGKPGRDWGALRDLRYLKLTALNGLMTLHSTVPTFALPLWITTRTHAPRALTGMIIVVNTAMVVGLQIKVAAGLDSTAKATAMMRRAGLALLAATAVIALAAGPPGWAATALLVAGVAGYTMGELWHVTSSYELMFRLAPEHAQGQYVGVFSLGQGLADAASPAVLGVLCLSWGRPGWLVLGGLLAVVGLLTPVALDRPESPQPVAEAIDKEPTPR